MESSSKLKASWIALATKAGKVIFPIAIKAGTVLAKVVKSGSMIKLGLGMASFGAYAILLDPRFAILLMVTLALHETGHVLMMRRFGMVTRGFYFIPLIGGAAVVESAFANAWNEAAVALAGPAVGLLTALVPYAMYLATGEKVFEVAACWIAFMNLLNLLPVHPLDGGRVMRALGMGLTGKRGAWLFAGVTLLGMGYCSSQGYGIFVLFGALGLGEELGRRYGKSRGDSLHSAIQERVNHREFRRKLSVALGLPPDTNRIDVIQQAIEAWQKDPTNAPTVEKFTDFAERTKECGKEKVLLTRKLSKHWHTASTMEEHIAGYLARQDGSETAEAFLDRVAVPPPKLRDRFTRMLREQKWLLDAEANILAPTTNRWKADPRSASFSEATKMRIDNKDANETTAAFLLFHHRGFMAPFTHAHAASRSDAELAFSPREAAVAILGYGILVFALFDLMEATGGHEAASHAVTFFKGL